MTDVAEGGAAPVSEETPLVFHEKIVHELAPGVKMSNVIAACWLPNDVKAMLAEGQPKAAEEGEAGGPPPPAFDPTLPDYLQLPKRLAKSIAMAGVAEMQAKIKGMEAKLEEVKEAIAKRKEKRQDEETQLTAAIEEAKAKVTEMEGSMGDIKASFGEADPLALVPWMRTLFALVEAGVSTLDVSPVAFPHCALRPVFTSDNQNSVYEGVERILGTFLRRYKAERGAGKVQVLSRLAPNVFHDAYTVDVLEPLVDKIRANLFGADATDPLDMVQLAWWDLKGRDFIPTLRKLVALSEDKIEINEEAGEFTVTEPKKIKAIGLLDFPYDAMLAVIHAGIKPASLSITYSLADATQHKTVQLCLKYGIKVFARGTLMGGLINEKYIGVPCPTTASKDPSLPSVAAAVDYVDAYGGWSKTQGLLKAIKKVADKHGVSMKTVAQRWVIDQGAIPVVPINWAAGTAQKLNDKLTDKPSFLETEDLKDLSEFVKMH